MEKNQSKYHWAIIILLSCCLCCLIIILLKSILFDNAEQELRNEIQYLSVYLKTDDKILSSPEEIDSILLNGGVVRVELSKDYFEKTGLKVGKNFKYETPIDYFNLLINYIGGFGWSMIEINDDMLYFSRVR